MRSWGDTGLLIGGLKGRESVVMREGNGREVSKVRVGNKIRETFEMREVERK